MKQYKKVTGFREMGYAFDSYLFLETDLIIRDTDRVNFYPYYNTVDSIPSINCVPTLIGDR